MGLFPWETGGECTLRWRENGEYNFKRKHPVTCGPPIIGPDRPSPRARIHDFGPTASLRHRPCQTAACLLLAVTLHQPTRLRAEVERERERERRSTPCINYLYKYFCRWLPSLHPKSWPGHLNPSLSTSARGREAPEYRVPLAP